MLRVAFVTGDRTYQPALLQTLAEWSAQDRGLALRTRGNQAGACILPISSARAFAGSVKGDDELAEQLHTWLLGAWTLATIAVPEYLWQRIRTEQDRLAAERKLDAWLVKPTDGIFARFNRRISIPISRQLIRFPITPNMVSIFTLGVSLLSGILFAMGGYLNMLAGALVGLFASILDGCDGEVARLKLQESAFGCWLETVCDYLYYLFMFAGMTIGLLRSSGARVYLYLGCVLVFGAVMSFVATAMQRRRLAAAGRPEQLLKNWQKEAERRKFQSAALSGAAHRIHRAPLLSALRDSVLCGFPDRSGSVHSGGGGRECCLAHRTLQLLDFPGRFRAARHRLMATMTKDLSVVVIDNNPVDT